MEYRVLVLRPLIVEEANPDNVLWKGQVSCPKSYESVATVQLNEALENNNRRSLSQWETLVTNIGLKYDLKYDHKYCREYYLLDLDLFKFNLQLFCCDISMANYALEVHEQEILNFLSLLDLKNSGHINPVALINRLENAREKMFLSSIKNPIITGLFFILEKLVLHCIDYESDISYDIERRKTV
jgi:hypothetical protein